MESFGHALRQAFLYHHANTTYKCFDNYDPFYAMCPLFDHLNAAGGGCALIAIYKACKGMVVVVVVVVVIMVAVVWE